MVLRTSILFLILYFKISPLLCYLKDFSNFTQLANEHGLVCQEHDVVTEDGYIIKLFHIPGDRRKPVFLMHGIADSADTYMIRGHSSMVATLAKAGYDVWVGNNRGNRYSRRHTTMNPDKDKKFWDFTYHEIGLYDLPASIDYILDRTGQTQLNCIGHSQGNTVFYVLGSMRPEYNEKIKLLIAMAPICFLHNLKGPAKYVIEAWPLAKNLLSNLGREEIFNDTSIEKHLVEAVCGQRENYELCGKQSFLQIAGYDPEELEADFIPITAAHYPSGTSVKSVTHLLNAGLSRKFTQFDYGFEGNMAVYNSVTPPSYDLSKVTMRIAIFVASNDGMCSLSDVKILSNYLPNVVEYLLMPWSKFNHLDYVWGRNMKKHLFPHVLSTLLRFNAD